MEHSSGAQEPVVVVKKDDQQVEKLSIKNRVKAFLEGYPKWKEGVFLTSVAGLGAMFGFGMTVASARKKDPEGYEKGLSSARKFENGVQLATRALKWGTFYAVTGCGVLFFGIWKLMGVKDLEEFRQKVGGILPRIPKKESQGRTEFESLTDLLQYIIDEDNKAKMEKKRIKELKGSEVNVSGSSDSSTESSPNPNVSRTNS